MRPKAFHVLLLAAAVAAAFLAAGPARGARALPPAGTDVLPLAGAVDVSTRIGTDHVALTGWVLIDRAAPRIDGGVEVVDLTVAGLELRGASQLGAVTVADRGGSRGELRSAAAGQDVPASLFIDLYADVSLPNTPFGPLALHNSGALHLAPSGAIDGWPPLAVTLRSQAIYGVDNDGDTAIDEDSADDDGDGLVDEDPPGNGDDDLDGATDEDPPIAQCTPALCDDDGDGAIDEDPGCLPLVNELGINGPIGLCARALALDVAPLLPSYSVRRGGPGHLHPADIFGLTPGGAGDRVQAPFVHITCLNLGLTGEGCDDGSDGDQDDIDAFSYGADLSPDGPGFVRFSVGPGAQGVEGSAVRGQRACPPAAPGLAPEAEPDVFGSALDGANAHLLDGNGPVGSCSPAFPLGLIESALVRDDLDALDSHPPSFANVQVGLPGRRVYYSLDTASPSLVSYNGTGATIFSSIYGAQPDRYASAAQLGLVAADDIDALCLRESGDGVFGPGDALLFSLAPGSPTLAAIDAGPGDLLAPGNPPPLVVAAAALGLLAGDNIDAVSCDAVPAALEGNGDVDCNGTADSIDAALVLQYDAGLLHALPCAAGGDVNKDGAIDSMDAATILRFSARLLPRLPVTA